MKVGILGCGYVGQAAAALWKQAGHFISATTRKSEHVLNLQPLVHQTYLLKDPSSLLSFLTQQEILLISLAADSSADYNKTYLETAQQISQLLPHAPQLRQILYTSSTSVYGDHQGNWVDETATIQPKSPNQQCLYETEQTLLNLTTTQRHVCIFRLGEIYGPKRDIAERLQRMQHQRFAGTGDSYTNLIHLTDIVKALDFAIEQQLTGVFNLCNDFHLPRKQFYEKLCQKTHLPPIQWDPQRSNPHGGNKKISSQKLKRQGFCFSEPTYPI